MAPKPPPPIWDIVEEQLDEATFLWAQWERSLRSPRYRLHDVEEGPEERLRAHVEGVACGAIPAIGRLLAPALGGKDGDRAAAATLALAQIAGAELKLAAGAIGSGPAERRSAVARALALSGHPGAADLLVSAARSGDAPAQAVALRAADLLDVALPQELASLLGSREPQTRAAAVLLSRRWGTSARGEVIKSLQDPEPLVRGAAIEAGLALGLRAAYDASVLAIQAGAPGLDVAALVLGANAADSDVELLEAALGQPGLRAAALRGLGLSGRARAAELCVQHLGDPRVAQVAGEAFSAITGAAIDGELLAPEEEVPDEPVPFEEDDLDADLTTGPQAELPVPDPEPVARWWSEHRARFSGRGRHLDGQPWSPRALVDAFLQGSMRRREPLGLELLARGSPFPLRPGLWARTQRLAQATASGKLPAADPLSSILRR